MDLILVVMRRMLRRWGMEGFRVYGSSPFVGNKQSIGYMTDKDGKHFEPLFSPSLTDERDMRKEVWTCIFSNDLQI